MPSTKLTLIVLVALNEIRGIIVTAPAWVWLWHHWHNLGALRNLPLFHH